MKTVCKILNKILKTLSKKKSGSTLAEFAVVTAMMATFISTSVPKFSDIMEIGKEQKTKDEIDKIITQGMAFYNETTKSEGRGRFPGQKKFNEQVGGTEYDNTDATSTGTASALTNSALHNDDIMADLGLDGSDGWQQYDDQPSNDWISVFGSDRSDEHKGVTDCVECSDEWLPLFGDEVLGSRFQDGHYAYTVVAGGGSGNDVYPPVIYVVDVENAVDFNSVLEP